MMMTLQAALAEATASKMKGSDDDIKAETDQGPTRSEDDEKSHDDVISDSGAATDDVMPATAEDVFRIAAEAGRAPAISGEPFPKRVALSNKSPDYIHLHGLLNQFDLPTYPTLVSLVTAQMNARKGVALFGREGETAIAIELDQLLFRRVLHVVPASSLSIKQQRAALRYLMFLKQKQCGTIEGRGCADGQKQRSYKTKLEVSSPTLSNEALFLSCLINAVEWRTVLTCDIPNAVMQADTDEVLHVKLVGTILEILLRLDPSFARFVTVECGKKVLYTQLDKALYGAL